MSFGTIKTTVTIDTQVGVEIDGDLKQVSHVAPDGHARVLRVRLVFNQCDTCGALLLNEVAKHLAWHKVTTLDIAMSP